MYQTFYNKLHLYFGENNLKSNYLDTDSLVLSFETGDCYRSQKFTSKI